MKKCQNCGNELLDNASFCTVCGTKQIFDQPTESPKTITLVCSKCSGTMTVDENNRSLFCPYCGSKELILESDAVATEKIRALTQKEIEFKKIEQQEEEKKKESIKKRKLPVVALVFGIVSLIFSVVSFSMGNISTGFIILIQTSLFVFSFVSGKGLISDVDFGNVFILSAVAGWIEYIPLFISLAK